MTQKKVLIGGDWRTATESFEVRSPYSGEVLANVGSIGPVELAETIDAAEAAAAEMRHLSRFEIAAGLRNIAGLISNRREEFAKAIAAEAAKPIVDARRETDRAIAAFATAAGDAERFVGEVVPVDAQSGGIGRSAWTERIPRGVIYGISPFNFPLNLTAHKAAPALAAKNAIILKPSRRTPLSALLLAEVFLESGLPQSGLQIVPMDNKYMDGVFGDERVKMISFTGSDKVGWEIRSRAQKAAVALELGGNAAVIVDETADVRKTAERAASAAFSYAGQVCISVQRAYVHESIFDEWLEAAVGKAKSLKIGDPLEEETEMSVMIDEKAAERASKWIQEAAENGADVVCGGERDGSLLRATIITGTQPEMRVVSEEVFAPVLVAEKFDDLGAAVAAVNNSRYGLQAGVFTQDIKNAVFAAENIEAGGVMINDVPTFRVDNMPYGGVKDSGMGREGVRYAMEEMSELRLIVMNM